MQVTVWKGKFHEIRRQYEACKSELGQQRDLIKKDELSKKVANESQISALNTALNKLTEAHLGDNSSKMEVNELKMKFADLTFKESETRRCLEDSIKARAEVENMRLEIVSKNRMEIMVR